MENVLGTRKGFKAGLKLGEDHRLRRQHSPATLLRLTTTGERVEHEVAVAFITLFLGYAALYVVLYLLRTAGFLANIDWIVLPAEAVENL